MAFNLMKNFITQQKCDLITNKKFHYFALHWLIPFVLKQERAEWINSIFQQLWPNVGHYTRRLIAETIEPAVKTALEGYGLAGFKFEKVVLGQIPPRVTGIKVYDKNVGRDEIILDLVTILHSFHWKYFF